ncbi:Rho GTPase activation protein [Pilaira anomala]|nr:Rho GTPase activation protein [Pilaira anomala]
MSALFGSTLVTALARSSFTTSSGLCIPGVLARIFHELQEKGLDVEGIFRKSGSNAVLNQLQVQLEENTNPFLVKFPHTVSSHTLAGLFKRYLQQLPEPVIPRQFQPLFLDIFDEEMCTKETLKRRLKEVCKLLPHEHLHLLQFLMEVADMVQQKQAENQMSIESLAIIFAPTCVRIDGVSKLMPSTTYVTPVCSSYTSLPVTVNKPQLFRKASKMLWNTIRSKKRLSYDDSSTLLYKPNELLQLELVKESNTWIKIFRFMMSHPEVFTTLTNPLKSQKYKHRPLTKTISIKPKQEWNNTFTQQEKKMLIDFKTLEFTESHDLLKTFGSFDINFDHDIQPQNNKKPSPVPSTTAPSKYVETLLNWKTREEENPHIIIPIVKRSTSPQPSDWLKAL